MSSDASSPGGRTERVRSTVRAPVRAATDANARLDEWLAATSPRRLRQLALALVALTLFSSPVVAQSAAQEAGSAMCQTGLGSLITFVLGMVSVGLVLLSSFRGAVAWNNLGSARSDKKQQGRDQLKGAGITLGGAFLPPVFGVALDQAGIETLSCVEFGNVMTVTFVDVVAQIVTAAPT